MMQYHFKETKGSIFIVRPLHAMLDCVTFMIESDVIWDTVSFWQSEIYEPNFYSMCTMKWSLRKTNL